MTKKTTLLLPFAILSAAFAQGQCTIQQQAVTPNANVICSGKGTFGIQSSEPGVDYYLRKDSDNSIVDGPVAGTGGPLTFTSNMVSSPAIYNINAVETSRALDFERDNGENVNLGTGLNSLFAGTNQITVEAWINIESNTNLQTIVGNYNSGMQFLFRLDDGKPTFWVSDGSYAAVQATTVVPLNTWVHIAGTWDGSTMSIYYNGVLEGTTSKGGFFQGTSNDLRIGASYGSEMFDGRIDNLKIWNVAKSATDINNDKSLCVTVAPNLVASYNFDNISSSTLIDESGNNHNGTIVGATVKNGTSVCSNSCSLQMVTKPTITIVPISQAAITNTNVICSGSGNVTVAASQSGINYYLRNDANDAIVAGPVAGTGGALTMNSGVVNTSSTYNVYAVKPSSALSFDGVDDYGVIPVSTNINSQFSSNRITLEGWFFIEQKPYDDAQLITESYLGDGNVSFSMSLNGGTLKAGFYNGGWQAVYAGIPFNQWVHIACTYDQSNIKLYYNGVLIVNSPNNNALPIGANEWRLGRRYDGDYNPDFLFKGKMDEVRIWNVARTQTQITAAMDSCLTGSENNLVAYYKFEDGGSTVADIAGGDQNVSLFNFDQATAYMSGREACSTCSLEMTVKPTVTVNPIGQQAVTPANTNVICSGSGTVTVAGSEANVNYYLRNDANDSIVSGPLAGTGSALTFNTGMVSSSSTFNVYATKQSTALNFDGNDDFVSIQNNANLPAGNSNYTIEAWIKPDAYGIRGIVGWGNYGTDNEVNALRLNGSNQLVNYWWNVDLVVTVPNLNNGQWHHVAVTYDGTTRRMIVDGVELGSDTPAAHNVTVANNLTIGSTNYYEYFGGGIDEVRIWNVARTAAQLSASMNSCLSGTETGLVAYYNFENIAGTSLTDVTGGSTGTLMNMNLSTAPIMGTINCGCTAEMTTKPMVTVNSIADQIPTAGQLSICDNGSTTIDLATSQATVSYYLRNDLNDTIIAGPVAGNGSAISFNTGVISATTTYNVFAESAPANHALDFDGSGYVSVPSGINIANQSFTIEFWAKRNNSNAYNFVIGQGTSNTDDGLHIGFRDNNNFTFAFYGDDLDVSTSASSDGNYHHYSCVYNAGQSGTNKFVYIDGNLAGSNSAADYTGSGELKIGSSAWGDNFNGSIDEVKIWNKALTPAEMQNGMNTCLLGNEAGLIAYYNMNAVSNTLADLSGNGHNGSLVNMDSATDYISGAPSVVCTRCELEMSQTATVTIKHSSTATMAATACDTYTALDNAVYTTSGIKTVVISNTAGCDSIITLDLTIKNSSTSTMSATECDSYQAVDGTVYTTTGIKTVVIPNTIGCDSIITLDLTIINSSNSTLTEIACNSYTAPDGSVYTTSGTKTAIISNMAGCDSIITINLTINSADVSVVQNGVTITANAANASYMWIDCSNNSAINGETSQSFTAVANGSYAVVVTENGCVDTSACTNITTTDVMNGSAENAFSVYPSPASETVTVELGADMMQASKVITIYDPLGKMVYSTAVTSKKTVINLNSLSKGIYFIKLQTSNGEVFKKIIKE